MSERKEKIYSRRYPQALEIMELINRSQTKEEREAAKQSFNEFWRQLQEESVYILMPERIKGARRFVALAKELSEAYGIDMDIWEKSYFIQVDLHLYCASYPTELTQRVAELFCLCDRFHSFILPQEPGDFTLSLDFYTHQYYLSGRLMNG